jgi:hypothetical protein
MDAIDGVRMKVSQGRHSGIQRAITGVNSRKRSAVSSGRKHFIDGNPNSAWTRRYHDLVVGHISDAGGMELVSEAKLAIIKRCAGLECEIERLEAKLSRGESVNLDEYGRAASHLRRLFESIGIERRPRDVTPNYIESKYVAED